MMYEIRTNYGRYITDAEPDKIREAMNLYIGAEISKGRRLENIIFTYTPVRFVPKDLLNQGRTLDIRI